MSPGADTPGMCRSAILATALGLIGISVDAMFWRTVEGGALWRQLAYVGLAGALLLLLLSKRIRSSESACTAIFVVNVAAALATLWASDDRLAHTQQPWSAFDAQKLGALALALLAPPRAWVGIGSIAAFTLVPLVEFTLWGPVVRARLPVGTPWAPIAYGAFSLILYAHELRRIALAQRIARSEAEREAASRLAQVALAIRDLANTPVQTIQISLALLRHHGSGEPRLLDRIERANGRLVELDRLLDAYKTDEASQRVLQGFDPIAVLTKRARPPP
jgi:hypothetical protein